MSEKNTMTTTAPAADNVTFGRRTVREYDDWKVKLGRGRVLTLDPISYSHS